MSEQKAIISKGAGQWIANVYEGNRFLYTVATGDTLDEARAHLKQWMEERNRRMPVEVVK